MWQTLSSPVGTLLHLDMNSSGTLATFQNGNPIQPMLSTDLGNSWQTMSGSGGPNSLAVFDQRWHIANSGTLLFTGSTGASNSMWRSDDGGNSFQTVAGSPQGFFFDFASAPNGDIYLYGEGVYRSTDDGVTWTQIVPGTTTYQSFTVNANRIIVADFTAVHVGNLDGSNFQVVVMSPIDPHPVLDMTIGLNGRIVAVGQNDIVVTSVDDGATWQVVDNGLSPGISELDRIAASATSDIWVGAKQTSVRFTNDAGSSWIVAENGLNLAPNEPIQALFCDPNQTFLMYNYSGIYRLNTSTSLAESEEHWLMVFPNPVTDLVQIVGTSEIGSLIISDISGKEVAHVAPLRNGCIDLSFLDSGVYLLRELNQGYTARVVVDR